MPEIDVFRLTTENRIRTAELLAGLDPPDWRASTLCTGWTVRQLAGHLLQPVLVGFLRFAVTSLRYRGDTDRTVDHFAHRLGERSPGEIVELLRRHAANRIDPPRVGPWGPFADASIHLRDLARPLGLAVDAPQEHWLVLLDYLVSAEVAPALVPPGRLDGLGFEATDAAWRRGDGLPLRGTSEALAMAVSGRRAVLPELDGEGVPVLLQRLDRPVATRRSR